MVDLSAPIVASPPELPDVLRTDIEFQTHAEGAQAIEAMLGVPPALLRDGEGWAIEEFTRFGTHNSPTSTRPGTTTRRSGGERAQTIDELPLEWFFADGVVLDMTRKADGEKVEVDDVEAALAAHRARPDAAGHRAGADRPRRLLRPSRTTWGAAAAVTAEATRWLYERGVRVMGIDAWGWDGPLDLPGQEALARGEPGVFWAAHQCDLPYSQIERLVNLGALPSTGFQVTCFPLRIVGGSAGPARVVAILD